MLEFDLTFVEEPVTIKDSKGMLKEYIIRELDGAGRDKYLTGISDRAKFSPDGKAIGAKTFNGIMSSLLTLCLVDKETGKNVDEKIIQSWPSRVQNELFKKAKELSKLDEGAETEAKND